MDNRAMIAPQGMLFYALAFLLGVVSVQQLSSLPPYSFSILLLAMGLVLLAGVRVLPYRYSCYYSQYTLIICFTILIIIGILYTCYFAGIRLNHRLVEADAGRDMHVSGTVVSIPKRSGYVQRFEFKLDAGLLPADTGGTASSKLRKIRLSWYYGQRVNAGERWQLTVRLKPPHGFRNPGGFDYEGWLFQQGIDATGYVRKSDFNRRLKAAPWWSINRWRQYLGEKIAQARPVGKNSRQNDSQDNAYAILRALAIGDRSALSRQQWRVFSATGTSHLMAISGLHIGLAFLFAWVAVRYALPEAVMKKMPAQHAAIPAGLLLALCYAMLAGMTIPTQRALIMLVVLSLMQLLRRNHRPQDSLGLALLLVLLFDPLAVLSAGFWFSFSAVAVIFISLRTATDSQSDLPIGHRLWRMLRHWWRLQLFISLCLLPLSLFMFQQASLISPLANLVMIPYVSFLLVPLLLLAMLLQLPAPSLAEGLLQAAAWLLQQIWPFLHYLSGLSFAVWERGGIRLWEMLLAIAGLLLLLLFHPVRQRFGQVGRPVAGNHSRQTILFGVMLIVAAMMLVLPLMLKNTRPVQAGTFRLTVLDVGQGSAAVIETAAHTLVFDTGARFGPRFDAGSAVVVPFLRAQGLVPDRLVISHGDADHIGGAEAILAAFPGIELWGQDMDTLAKDGKTPCQRGMRWQWDGVDFEFLSPDGQASADSKRNNHSCVLRVASPAGAALLGGDIEKKIENQLLAELPARLVADVLVVAHHGSNTSSGTGFLSAVSPEIAVISVAYRNRYGLPSRRVLERFRQLGVEPMQTWRNGAVTVTFRLGHRPVVKTYRQQARKYWHRSFP